MNEIQCTKMLFAVNTVIFGLISLSYIFCFKFYLTCNVIIKLGQFMSSRTFYAKKDVSWILHRCFVHCEWCDFSFANPVYVILKVYFCPWKDFKCSCCALITEELHCFSVVCIHRCCCCCFCCCLCQLMQEARLAVNRAWRGWGGGAVNLSQLPSLRHPLPVAP